MPRHKPIEVKGQEALFEPPPYERPDKSTVRVPLHPLWTENKAKLIERYLFYFVLVTKHGTYIDGFSGPQGAPENWGARLVLETEPPWLRHFYLFDSNPEQVSRLEELKAKHPSRDVEVFPGDFNQRVHEILRPQIISDKEATFCLIDQRTFECEWSTVEKLARYKKGPHKIEIFYFLANWWFARALGAVKGDKALRWWGRDDWSALADMHGQQRAELLANRFRKELGYLSARAWTIYAKENGRRVAYYMIHATDHPRAPALMTRAYEKVVQPKEPIDQLVIEFAIPSPADLREASGPTEDRRGLARQPLESGRPTA
jgi:three-Cys-motif partner protein